MGKSREEDFKPYKLKKVLILAQDFPPKNTIGAQRPYSWFKYFNSIGYNTFVVTTDENTDDFNDIINSHNVIYSKCKLNLQEKFIQKFGKNRFKILRKIISFNVSIFQYIFSYYDKNYEIYVQSKEILKTNEIDCIIATGQPFTLFKYAHKLSSNYGVDWFADYRDDWIDDHGRRNKGFLDKIIRFCEKQYEKKYLSNSSGIISVSDFLVKEISKRVNPKCSITIENGIDLDYIKNSKIILDENFFNIVYTGTFYESHYMEIFYNGFKKFYENNRNDNVRIYFVGIEKTKCSPYYKAIEMKNEYKNIIKIIDQVDIQTATNYQISSTILLNFIPGDPSKGIIGAKSYSYAATGKPILLIPEIPNRNSPFFPGRNIQNIAVDENEVFIYLSNKYIEFEKNQEIKTDISKEEIIKLSRNFKANELAEWILKKKLSNQWLFQF